MGDGKCSTGHHLAVHAAGQRRWCLADREGGPMSPEQSVVFVIDDDPSMRESLESLLRSVGHAAQAFGSTQEFLLSERPDMPGCLVLDVRLPGRSGLEFQRERSEEHTSELQSLMRISYAVFCLKKKNTIHKINKESSTSKHRS